MRRVISPPFRVGNFITTLVAHAGDNQTVAVGTTVNFNGGASQVPDEGNFVYSWNFGADANPVTDNGVTTSCTYSTSGVKTVTLTVRDDEGNQEDSATCTITVFEVVITSTTLPNDAVSFTTRNGENQIQCVADIRPDSLDDTYNAQIEWEIEDNPDVGGISGNPADPETGNEVTLTITAPTAAAGRNYRLNYRIQASLTIAGSTATCDWTTIQQDGRDYLRQQYLDVNPGRVAPPARTALVTAATYVNPGNLNFNELNCNGGGFCANHAYQLDDTVSDLFQQVRNEVGVAIRITSCYRCPRYNRSVNGVPNSRHIRGQAFDFDNGTAANWTIATEAADQGGAEIPTTSILLYSQDGTRLTLMQLIDGGFNANNLPPGWTEYRNGHISTSWN